MAPRFSPTDLLQQNDSGNPRAAHHILGPSWLPILQHECDFGADIFLDVSFNHLRNPNINSSHLFRADILYDSQGDEFVDKDGLPEADVQTLVESWSLRPEQIPGFEVKRTLIRQLVPRNPQLDRPIAQTCHLLVSTISREPKKHLLVYLPHVSSSEALPWYHPAVKALAYLYSPAPEPQTRTDDGESPDKAPSGVVSLHYQLFPDQELPLPDRMLRTANNLLGTLYKHGQGSLAGYTKKVFHDQLISQQRVQDTYTDLKKKYAKRLCTDWVEQTEPSKHVFEDLGIAAFLIELWKDMYQPPADQAGHSVPDLDPSNAHLPPFPGFVDIGCGNGVLTEVLLLSGFPGWGLDARRRKTWAILSKTTQSRLHELLLVPQPLFDLNPPSRLDRVLSIISPQPSALRPPSKPWHNGIFPKGTFLVSNHADELTAWTPLLAYLNHSPFLAIPCCSHNLSGARFRAPSAANSHTADTSAPSFFAAQKPKSPTKSIPISIAAHEDLSEDFSSLGVDTSADPPLQHRHQSSSQPSRPETGKLKDLSPAARAKQPSAYASLCEWVVHLSEEVYFKAEREMLRIPSTRNMGIIGRVWRDGKETEPDEERKRRVLELATREGADGKAYVQRCEGVLAKDGYKGHG